MDHTETPISLEELREIRDRADGVTEPALIHALKNGVRPSDIARITGISDSHIRRIRRQHRDCCDLQPDPRYAHLAGPHHASGKENT